MTWHILIEDEDNRPMGDPIPCDCWSILSRLATVREMIPPHWNAEAYPAMRTEDWE